jgi:3-dehydroquinate synthase
VPHGIAVTYGMEMSNGLSAHIGFLAVSDRQRMDAVLAEVRSGIPLGAIDQAGLQAALLRDKKNEGGRMGLILTRGPGDMFKHFVPPDAAFSAWLTEHLRGLESEGACRIV